ncbi:hypothetical protein J6590_093168 [Homalodisca vitripennis]|nr:hypothetical protein J6590_093168 [Homalodisca vitripennis]
MFSVSLGVPMARWSKTFDFGPDTIDLVLYRLSLFCLIRSSQRPVAHEDGRAACKAGSLSGHPSSSHARRCLIHSGVQFGEFDRSSLLREMTVGVGGVRSVSIRGSCYPQHKGVPLPACFDWRGWFRAGFSFPRGHDLTLNFSSGNSTGRGPFSKPYPSKYPVTPELRSL